MSYGVVIGRFQVASLTDGHKYLLKNAAYHNDGNLLVLVGEAPTQPNERNPLPFYVRAAMIQEAYPRAIVIPIMDCMEDEVWSKAVDHAIGTAIPRQAVTLFAGRESFASHYTGRFPVQEVTSNFPESGTQQRSRLKQVTMDSTDFRAGMIHSVMNQYPSVFPTVDIGVIYNRKVLVGCKAGETRWRLPGGFVDVADFSAELAAQRELVEETGLAILSQHFEYVGAYKVDDWRTKGTGNGVMTTLFGCPMTMAPTAVRPGDDLAKLDWLPLDISYEDTCKSLVPDHQFLFGELQRQYGR